MEKYTLFDGEVLLFEAQPFGQGLLFKAQWYNDSMEENVISYTRLRIGISFITTGLNIIMSKQKPSFICPPMADLSPVLSWMDN